MKLDVAQRHVESEATALAAPVEAEPPGPARQAADPDMFAFLVEIYETTHAADADR